MVELRSCGQRTHSSGDVAADGILMYERTGQYDSISDDSDSRPSHRIIVILKLDMGGPLLPTSRGPQTNAMAEFVELTSETSRLIVFEDEDDLRKQLLFRKAGNVKPENEVRWVTEDGNNPVTVISA